MVKKQLWNLMSHLYIMLKPQDIFLKDLISLKICLFSHVIISLIKFINILTWKETQIYHGKDMGRFDTEKQKICHGKETGTCETEKWPRNLKWKRDRKMWHRKTMEYWTWYRDWKIWCGKETEVSQGMKTGRFDLKKETALQGKKIKYLL